MTTRRPTVLTTGATGRVGRHVVSGLLERGATVRALVRHPATADLPPGVELVAGDLTEPASVAAAAAGADAAFLLWPSFSAEGAAEVVETLAAHVRHVVYLSAARLQRGQRGSMPGVWADVERLVERSGSSWTFVRAGGFAANTLAWADQLRSGDTVRLAFPLAARSLVHERDIADVAVRALLDPEHVGRSYAVTGPEVLTQVDQVGLIAKATGRPLQIEELTAQQIIDSAAPEERPILEASLAHWATLVGDPENSTDDVLAVTGRPALSLAQWAEEHAAQFGLVRA
ncbi:SDR family oxidoreductase [Blastococcus sp. SYSU DS0552]